MVVGLLSGPSGDGIDAAVVDVSKEDNALVVKLLGYAEAPMDEALRQRIHTLFSPEASRIDEVCEVNVLLGEAFASAAARVLRQAGVQAELVASHGQPVWHQDAARPTRSTPPFCW